MDASIFVFGSDLEDEGYDRVLDNVSERGGMQGVTLGTSYHHSRDLFPHNPVGKIRFLSGQVFFRPDAALFTDTEMRPFVSPYAQRHDPLDTLVAKAGKRGLAVRAWTNNMHNTDLGERYPNSVIENAFGDRIITSLCPANPSVRAYVCALSANIARYSVQSLLLESVVYMPYDHGYHHERTLLPLSGAQRFMMSLCFCAHCFSAGHAANVDMQEVRGFVKDEMQRFFDGTPSVLDDVALDLAAIGDLLSGAFGRLIRARQATISTLMTSIVSAVRRERSLPVVFMDMSGGVRGAGSGMNVVGATATAPERAWQDGVDFTSLAGIADGIAVLAYSADHSQVRADLSAYRARLPQGLPLSVAVRPMLPDCRSASEVVDLVRVVAEARPAWLDFYHYGMMRLESLDWIRQALVH